MSVPSSENESINGATGINILCEARFQNGYFSFYRERPSFSQNSITYPKIGAFVVCDNKLHPIDTIQGFPGDVINAHDFRINDKGEKMVMTILDTLLDLRSVSNYQADSSVSAGVTLIEIFDRADKLIFRWNSAKVLGANSVYYPYLSNTHTYFNRKNLDWSHGNSVLWDADGNILYSLRYIGVGKISRKDGHVLWRVDRKDMPIISATDTMEFYSQHDLEYISDSGLYETYSLVSNGDDEHPISHALIFSVNKQTSAIRILQKKYPAENVFSRGGGSYEIDSIGNQLFSYGHYPMDDTSHQEHFFLECRDKSGQLQTKYKLPYFVFNDKVHRLNEWRPPRPTVSRNKNTLTVYGEMTGWVWYELKGAGKTIVTKVGEGVSFTPPYNGIFCAAGQYGAGYSVSLPFSFEK